MDKLPAAILRVFGCCMNPSTRVLVLCRRRRSRSSIGSCRRTGRSGSGRRRSTRRTWRGWETPRGSWRETKRQCSGSLIRWETFVCLRSVLDQWELPVVHFLTVNHAAVRLPKYLPEFSSSIPYPPVEDSLHHIRWIPIPRQLPVSGAGPTGAPPLLLLITA